jgi:hypothetical protein
VEIAVVRDLGLSLAAAAFAAAKFAELADIAELAELTLKLFS